MVWACSGSRFCGGQGRGLLRPCLQRGLRKVPNTALFVIWYFGPEKPVLSVHKTGVTHSLDDEGSIQFTIIMAAEVARNK